MQDSERMMLKLIEEFTKFIRLEYKERTGADLKSFTYSFGPVVFKLDIVDSNE